MNKIIRQFLIVFLLFLYSTSTLAVSYNYTTLIFKDYPDLKPLVNNALSESRRFRYPQDGLRAVSPLKKSLRMLLSRPDGDNLISKLSSELIRDLESMGVFHATVDELISQGKEDVFNKALSSKVRTTSLIMLNNLLFLIRPRTLKSLPLAKSVCKLADENLKIPRKILHTAELTTMFKEVSPTNLAKKIMYWYAKQKNKKVQSLKKGCPFSKRT